MVPENGHAAHAQGSAVTQISKRAAANRQDDEESVSLCCSKMVRFPHARKLQNAQGLRSHSSFGHDAADAAPWCHTGKSNSRHDIAELMAHVPRSFSPQCSPSPPKSHRTNELGEDLPQHVFDAEAHRQLFGEGLEEGSHGGHRLSLGGHPVAAFGRPVSTGTNRSSLAASPTLPDLPFNLIDAEDRDVLSNLESPVSWLVMGRGSFRAPRDERVHHLRTPTPQETPITTPTGSAISSSLLLLWSPKSANTITPTHSNEPAGWGHILAAYHNTLAPPPRPSNWGEPEADRAQPMAPPRTPHDPQHDRQSEEMVVKAPRRPSIVADAHAAPRRGSISECHTTPPRTARRGSVTDITPPRTARRGSVTDVTPPRTARRGSVTDVTQPRTARRGSVTESLATPPRTGRRASVASSRRQSVDETVITVPRRLSIDDGVKAVPPRRGSTRRGSVVSRFSHTPSDRESSRTTARGSSPPSGSTPTTLTKSPKVISESGEAFNKGLVSIKADFGFEKGSSFGFGNSSIEFLENGRGQGVSPHKVLYEDEDDAWDYGKSRGAMDLVSNLIGIIPFMGHAVSPPHNRERRPSWQPERLEPQQPLLPIE